MSKEKQTPIFLKLSRKIEMKGNFLTRFMKYYSDTEHKDITQKNKTKDQYPLWI